MAGTTEINISENIRFYGSLMGTPGITDENNALCNERIKRLLIALEPFVKDYEDEAMETMKLRESEKQRLADDPDDNAPKILAPTSYDMNNLKIK